MNTKVLGGADSAPPAQCEDTLHAEDESDSRIAIDDVQAGIVCTHCWQVHPDPEHPSCPICGTACPLDGWPEMPYRLNDRYQLNRLLGRGGMGAVFLAADLGDGADQAGKAPGRAIKLVQRTAASNARTLSAMFEHEVAASALLGRSPSFVTIFGYETGSRPVLVMEPVAWPTLAKYLRGGTMSSRAAAALGIATLEAIEIMHFYRVVHLDLKPSNMFVDAHENTYRVKVADLGIWAQDHDRSIPEALRRRTTTIQGTPGYMSPEQMFGSAIGCRSDLHTIGSILWECVAGTLPFPPIGDDLVSRITARREAVRTRPERPEDMSEELYEVLSKALEYEASDRYENARAFIEALRHVVNESTWITDTMVEIENLIDRIEELRPLAADTPRDLSQLDSVNRGLTALKRTLGSEGHVARRAAARLVDSARQDIAELTDKLSDPYAQQRRNATDAECDPDSPTVQLSSGQLEPHPGDTAEAEIAEEWIDPAARYEIDSLVGVGGAARVYAARHRILGRKVALRVMCSSNIARIGVSEERTFFFAMSHAASLVEHPNVARVYDYGVGSDGVPYAVLEYLDGESLFDSLSRRRYVPESEAVAILEPIASALVGAHEVGVLHRNLKLARVVMRPIPGAGIVPTLFGFGFEKPDADALLPKGRYYGTPQYMSPEQTCKADVSFPADIYALGTIAFRLLSGTYPFWRGDHRDVIRAKRTEDAPLLPATTPGGEPISEEMRAFVTATLQRNPAARPDCIGTLDGLRALWRNQ